MPGPEVGSVDDTRKILRRTADDAGAGTRTDHIATVDDRMVYRRIGSRVVPRDPARPERDKRRALRIDPIRFRPAASCPASALCHAADTTPLTLHVGCFVVRDRPLDGLPNRISHNASLGAASKDSVAAGISR